MSAYIWDLSIIHGQEVKELVRGTREAVGSNFLGSLESFLVYLDALMKYCELFLEDRQAEAAMKVHMSPSPSLQRISALSINLERSSQDRQRVVHLHLLWYIQTLARQKRPCSALHMPGFSNINNAPFCLTQVLIETFACVYPNFAPIVGMALLHAECCHACP